MGGPCVVRSSVPPAPVVSSPARGHQSELPTHILRRDAVPPDRGEAAARGAFVRRRQLQNLRPPCMLRHTVQTNAVAK
ncbi:unnamed protein product [Amoebophrya sp. A120]|nr:unnamed protein product [Amoebophrya sp. A120]|eukprot:GSA120T00025474001.1